MDEVNYVDQVTDVSFSRIPNGTGNFESTSAVTFNSENGMTISTNAAIAEVATLKAFPNPARDFFYLKFDAVEQKERDVLIYDMIGNAVFQGKISQNITIDVSKWSPGMYIVKVGNSFLKISVL